MDAAARKVLKTKKRDIVRNLLLNDEILDSLEEKGTLTEDMIQSVKVMMLHALSLDVNLTSSYINIIMKSSVNL